MNSKRLKTKINKGIKLSEAEEKYLVALMNKHTKHLNIILDMIIRSDRVKDNEDIPF
jgi:hypothetical protein